ncbi:hypothetical protein O3G_MSEX001969 [Manduca sexta]|uniref:Peroxidase n=1 Tax=Manduca sexta TaxID=7130 RepID=A0A921YLT8_MANSE|nr:hypothetical protein O3G_MSEX001969 [Manduca sexta]
MYSLEVLLFVLIISWSNGVDFDRFSGKKVDVAQSKELRSKNATERCSFEVKPCTPHEGSRIDGTCNNYKEPAKGAAKGAYLRLLKPDYANKRLIRKNKNGEELPSARKVRTELETTGRIEDRYMFNIATYHMLEFIQRDISLLNGPLDYLRKRQYCCKPAGEADPRCIPIRVPDNDPYLKVTDIRCLNFSRAETFQDMGCTPDTIHPEQINYQTPLIDLSTIYGVDNKTAASIRKGKHGFITLERRGERHVPPANMTIINITISDIPIANNISEDVCIQNLRNESRCYEFGFPEAGNFNLRTTTLGIFFIREHNRLAKILHEINPCWKDDRLFKIARQINIATVSNIFMYELLPALLGYKNMVNYGLISEHVEHVSAYDEDAVPLVYAEYEIAVRFFHTMLDGRIKRYNEKHHYIGDFSISETLYRQDLIEQNKYFEEINRGTFDQSASKIDDILDPEVSENFYANLQQAHDIGAIDIQRGRDLGVRGYNDYRHLCGLKPAKKFKDFLDVMDFEKVEALKKLYNDTDDVDLLAGILSENSMQGTYVGPTLFCIMAKQLQLFRFSDRFWYERGDQLHSLTLCKLIALRFIFQ